MTLVTTEKDLVRLQQTNSRNLREIVQFAVTMEFADGGRLRKFVADRLLRAREKIFLHTT